MRFYDASGIESLAVPVEFTYQLGRAMGGSSGGRLLTAFVSGYASR